MASKCLIRFIFIIILFITSSCTVSDDSTNQSHYVTFTYSKNVNEKENSAIRTELWIYDIRTDETEKKFELEYTSQYPLGFYDMSNDQIYYTKRVVNKMTTGDQIFVTNLENNREIQLTNDLFAVNYIHSVGEKVFFVARPHDSKVLKLGSINRETGEISFWGDEDTVVEAMTVDQEKKRIYISTYSDNERRYNVMHQDGPAGQNNFKMPLHKVYETDFSFKNTRELISEYEWIRTIMTDGANVIAISDKQYNDPSTPSTLIYYNTVNDTITKKPWHTNRLQVGDANYSSDGKSIYAICVVNNKRGLYAYKEEVNEFIEIFAPESGFINNIQVVKP